MRRAMALLAACLAVTCGAGLGQEFTEEERKAAIELLERYRNAGDKLAFLLKHAGSENESMLVWVATELGNFDDPRSIAALRKLLAHEQRDRLIPAVAARARWSLERISAADVLGAITAKDKPLAQKLPLIREAAAKPKNEYARDQILVFLCKHVDEAPADVVPLLVEFFAYDKRARHHAVKHRKVALTAIVKGLRNPEPFVAEPFVAAGAAKLAGQLKAAEASGQLASFLYADRAKLEGTRVWAEAMTALAELGDSAVPALENVLYSRNRLARLDAINVLGRIGSERAAQALVSFKGYLEGPPRAAAGRRGRRGRRAASRGRARSWRDSQKAGEWDIPATVNRIGTTTAPAAHPG